MRGGEQDDAEAFRRFSRFYTRLIGLLDESLLQSGLSLPEGRVVFELGRRGRASAAEIGQALGLDAGYLSRLLKGLGDRALVDRATSTEDRRRTDLSLTPEGRALYGRIDAASREEVLGILGRVGPGERARVLGAMAEIERLLGGPADAAAAPGPRVTYRPLRTGDVGWIAHRQGLLYAQEYGWDGTFEALVAEIAAAFAKDHDPVRERAWIAELGGAPVGSCFLVRQSDEVAKLRLLYVEPQARGLGIGRALTQTCIAVAREQGYRTLTLWTNDILTAARRIYQEAGFTLVASEPHHSFGNDLVGEVWELGL